VARLYSTETFPLPVVEELRRLGHDVITIQETGRADQRTSDDQVLEFAVADARAVVTLNRKDFRRLHQHSPSHYGIIVCTVDEDFLGQAQRIHAEISTTGDLSGKLIRVNRPAI
jgi:hypothetical protein